MSVPFPKSLLNNLLRSCSGRYRTVRSQTPKRFRPALEALEDRLTPASFTVTDTSDSVSDTGSLRYAITNAQNGDSITFNSSLSGQTITLGSVLEISKNVTITGLGASNLVISGDHSTEVFQVDVGVTGSISSLTVENGSGGNLGGGIENKGTLTLSYCTLSGNATSSSGGGINNAGTLTLSYCTLSGNTSFGFFSFGGGIQNNGALTISNSTFSGNSAQDGGAINNTGKLTLSNSTLSGNSAGGGGGILNTGTLTLSNSTLFGNSAGDGGGIDTFGIDSSLTLLNTIVAGNTATNEDPNVQGDVSANSTYNLIGNGTGLTGISNGDANHNQVGVSNPGLASLANNGGPTQTQACRTAVLPSALVASSRSWPPVSPLALPTPPSTSAMPPPLPGLRATTTS